MVGTNLVFDEEEEVRAKEVEELLEEMEKTYEYYRDAVIPSLPTKKGCWLNEDLYQYRGFWFRPSYGLEDVLWMQEHFKPRPNDILLATPPKCGTTWLKALAFSVMNRTRYNGDDDHDPARIFSVHFPYSALPEKVKTLDQGRMIVYMCRDPMDMLISLWKFLSNIKGSMFAPEGAQPLTLELAFDMFCGDGFVFGPFLDHILEYWKASLERPDKVLFLKYEDFKKDGSTHLKRLAAFLGQPFTTEEEEKGAVDDILKLCSFESLSKVEANKKGTNQWGVKHDAFFRQGKVGDGKNHLTPDMIHRINRITREKFDGSGLTF